MSAIVIETGWFGWRPARVVTPLLPGIAWGLIRITWCRGSLLAAIKRASAP